MAKTKLLEDNVLVLGEKKSNAVVNFFFKFNEGITDKDIEYIRPDCSLCTHPKLETGGIRGYIELSKAGTYKNPKTPINKTIIIKYNDGESEFIADDNGIRINNPNSGSERLNIVSTVLK